MKKSYISPETKTLMTASGKPYLSINDMVACTPQSLMDFSAGKERVIDDSSFMPSDESSPSSGNFGSDNGPWESLW